VSQTAHGPGGSRASEDRQRVRRARDGDATAFRQLAAARAAGAYRLARAILPTDEDAADAVATAYAAAWRELPRLDDTDRFDDWLDRILISECRMRIGAGPGATAADAGAPVPAGLLARVAAAAGLDAPAGAPTRRRARGGARRWLGPIVVGASGVLVLAIVAAFATGQLFRQPAPRDSGAPASSAVAEGSPGQGAAPPPGSSATAGTTAPATGGGLTVGSLAVVTLQGDNLRVRTQPGTGGASKRLKPVLPAGTRVLVVSGPAQADGYDWYEIQTDGELIDLFGWVAAGAGGQPWLAPANAHCPSEPSSASIVALTRIDFLACFGHAPVQVTARADRLLRPAPDASDCGWARAGRTCTSSNRWLLFPTGTVGIPTAGGGSRDVAVAMPPDLAQALAGIPHRSTVLLTIAMDAPESATCRIKDATSGKDVVPADRAVTACRLEFVVSEVAFRDPDAPTPSATTGSN
jgi:hypothetical protein